MSITKQDLKVVLKQELSPIKEDIQSLKTDVGSLKKDVRSLKTDAISLKEGLKLQEKKQESLEHQVQTIATMVIKHDEQLKELTEITKDARKTVNDIYLFCDALLKKFNIIETEFHTLRDAKLPRMSKVVVKLAEKNKIRMPEVDQLRVEIL